MQGVGCRFCFPPRESQSSFGELANLTGCRLSAWSPSRLVAREKKQALRDDDIFGRDDDDKVGKEDSQEGGFEGDDCAASGSKYSATRSSASVRSSSPAAKSGTTSSGKKLRRLTVSAHLGGDGDNRADTSEPRNLDMATAAPEHEWESKLPLVPESIDALLPAGLLFGSISRIRGTVNMYTSKVAKPDWFVGFKVPTIQALERRLSAYSEQVVGRNHCDIQVGFKQVLSRVTALLEFHKSLRSWVTSQDDTVLAKTIPSYNVLNMFLDKTGQVMHADLQVVMTMSFFYECFGRTKSVHESLATVDFENFKKCLKELADENSAETEPPTKTSADAANFDMGSRAGNTPVDKKADKPVHRKGRKRFQTEGLDTRLNFNDAPLKHMGNLIVCSMKVTLFAMSRNFEPDELAKLLHEVDHLQSD